MDDDKKKPARESEALKAAKEVTRVSQNVANAASVAGGSGARASDIRNRFERGEGFQDADKSKEVRKRKTKLKYAGVGSMKDKFMQEAARAVNGSQDGQPRKLKEITPPREGVAVGVLESQPTSRPEGVEGADTGESTVTDYIGIGKKTKDMREKFKRLEQTGGVVSGQSVSEQGNPIDFHLNFQVSAVSISVIHRLLHLFISLLNDEFCSCFGKLFKGYKSEKLSGNAIRRMLRPFASSCVKNTQGLT